MTLIKSARQDECFILIKAHPHRSSKYSETVCCAGVGRDGKWRRQYPVPFRILNRSQQFGRWQWIKYTYVVSPNDRRIESQKVDPESLVVGEKVKVVERTNFLAPLVRSSFREANDRVESLTLLRPKKLELTWDLKSKAELEHERKKHAELAAQMSLFDSTAKPLNPCPYEFRFKWIDQEGSTRKHICDDWETAAAFLKFERMYSRAKALEILKEKYECEYFEKGLAFAFSTHSRRNVTNGTENQWLLVGVIRLDETSQHSLEL